MARNRGPIMDDGRPETPNEYHRRVQDEMDRAQWQGRQLDEWPKPAIVHEITPLDEQTPPHVYRIKK